MVVALRCLGVPGVGVWVLWVLWVLAEIHKATQSLAKATLRPKPSQSHPKTKAYPSHPTHTDTLSLAKPRPLP